MSFRNERVSLVPDQISLQLTEAESHLESVYHLEPQETYNVELAMYLVFNCLVEISVAFGIETTDQAGFEWFPMLGMGEEVFMGVSAPFFLEQSSE